MLTASSVSYEVCFELKDSCYLVCELVEGLGEARSKLKSGTGSGNHRNSSGRTCDVSAGVLDATSLATLVVEAARSWCSQVSSRGLSCQRAQALTRSARYCGLLHLCKDHRRTKGRSVSGGQLGKAMLAVFEE